MTETYALLTNRDHPSRAMEMVRSSHRINRLAWAFGGVFILMPVVLLFAPWRQNIGGAGRVVAYAPLDRQQQIEAPIDGRIVEWWVQEGSKVKAGDPVLEISDIDPNLVSRLEQERSALAAKLAAGEDKANSYEQQVANLQATRDLAVSAATHRVATAREKVRAASESVAAGKAAQRAAEAQFERNRNLLADGIVSRRQFEIAERDLEIARTTVTSAEASLEAARADQRAIEADLERIRADADAKIDSAQAALHDARGQVEEARASLAKMDVRLSRQQSQLVTAPRNGTVFRLVANQGGEIVKAGDPLVVLVPDTENRAVELWVDGNDAPLVREGSSVRLQFEGWPAVQFAGWPSVAVGTFGGKVALVDPTDDGAGQFRLLVMPDPDDEPWPDAPFLRQGVRARGWVLLNEVRIGYEIWRQLNGFPPVIANEKPKSDVARKRMK